MANEIKTVRAHIVSFLQSLTYPSVVKNPKGIVSHTPSLKQVFEGYLIYVALPTDTLQLGNNQARAFTGDDVQNWEIRVIGEQVLLEYPATNEDNLADIADVILNGFLASRKLSYTSGTTTVTLDKIKNVTPGTSRFVAQPYPLNAAPTDSIKTWNQWVFPFSITYHRSGSC